MGGRGSPGLRIPRRDLLVGGRWLASRDQPRRRRRGRHVERRAADRPRGAEADLDAHQAASVRRHRDQGARPGAQGADRFDGGAGRRRGRGSHDRPGPGARLPREVRRRPHRRRPYRVQLLQGPNRLAAVEGRRAEDGSASGHTPALVFVSFMGAGKTTAADAARAAGLDAVDADDILEEELGMPIITFFGHRGEEEFRSLEAAEVERILEDADGGAVALGGGAVYAERVRRALGRHIVVWLQVSAEEAWRRVEGSGRPLAKDRKRFEELHAERAPIYAHLADAFLPSADEELVSRALPALLGLRELPHGTRMAWGMSASGEYPAYVGPGLLDAGWWPLSSRRFCVADTTVAGLYGDAVQPLAGTVTVD